jgi:hypothetical protein
MARRDGVATLFMLDAMNLVGIVFSGLPALVIEDAGEVIRVRARTSGAHFRARAAEQGPRSARLSGEDSGGRSHRWSAGAGGGEAAVGAGSVPGAELGVGAGFRP